MASLDFDQKFLGRIAKQTQDSNPLLSASLYQILGLSVLLSRRLIRARKLRKLDTSRDTPSLAAYQHILWLSREGLSILELYVLPYAQDNQHGEECRVLSVKLRASFYHIFCLFHNQPPVTATNMPSNDPRSGAPPLPLSRREGNGQSRNPDAAAGYSPSSKRAGKQPMLREPIDSITSETSFLTNPYAAGGPVGTPSPGPLNAPPGLHPVPIPQPSSFLLPPLNFIPLAGGYFTTASAYAQTFLPGSHPLRLSVALEHSAFLWDCVHDHEGSRRLARRAIKDVYRAQEAMDDSEFEDAAELVGILGRMMKRKDWEGTPRVGAPSPAPADPSNPTVTSVDSTQDTRAAAAAAPNRERGEAYRHAAEGPPIPHSPAQRGAVRSRANSTSQSATKKPSGGGSNETTPRVGTQRTSGGTYETTPRLDNVRFGGGSQDTTPRARHVSIESGGSTTPRAPQGVGGRSPATPSTVRTIQQQPGSGGTIKGRSPVVADFPLLQSPAATLASETVRASPTLRRSPPLRSSPVQENAYSRQQR
jgi:hypothetical protein